MPAPSYSLQLGQTALIFFPPLYPDASTEHPSTEAQVVQVIVKPRYASSSILHQYMRVKLTWREHRKPTRRCIEVFYRFERDITTAIESLLLGHIISPLPERLSIEGDGYVLYGGEFPLSPSLSFNPSGTDIDRCRGIAQIVDRGSMDRIM
ncbi:hypothetical protein C0995_003126 [Termitomyces sp. Mi166|nr:hypothetical protein C0995_003126 [Termitomyces sp. Mi166\